MATTAVQRFVGTRFRRIITGDPSGTPPWLAEIEMGDDLGLFEPTDAPWVVHANLATLIGGVRALLMQTLHPGSLAGVAQHSRYEEDAIGRLAGTTRWLTITTFGSQAAIAIEAQRVNRMHDRVRGTATIAGEVRKYSARDEDLLRWVHMAFTESFLVAHETYADVAIPGGADEYVRQWSKSVVPLGLENVPMTRAELEAEIERLYETGVLSVSDKTFAVVKFLRKPPLSFTARLGYSFLFAAAVVTMPAHFQEMLKLPRYSRRLIRVVGRCFLRLLGLAIGAHSPIEEAALARRERLLELKSA